MTMPVFQRQQQIWVTFSREGIHAFPAAGTTDTLQDVSFLAHPHRHIFHFRVAIDVVHNDRDIEFIQFKRFLEAQYADGLLMLDNKSCEMIAEELHEKITARYPNRGMVIDVSEDNENGCTLSWRLINV